MPFVDAQLRKLKAKITPKHIKAREANGTTLHYLEGWHVIAEANRIFGFDGWDRETVASQCVWTKQLGSLFAAAYVVRIRVRVRAGDLTVVREGSGAGEATAATPGSAHELALKSAETDATKRALATFGNAFGLSLYGGSIEPADRQNRESTSRYLGASAETAAVSVRAERDLSIDKSRLHLAEPKRLRDLNHVGFVATKPCLICGRQPSHPHHLTFTQPRALGRKVSDEFTVPLCGLHHRELHHHGNERAWWVEKKINPLPVAKALWNESHGWAAPDTRLAILEAEAQVTKADSETAEDPA
jgi:DNA recombination protein Rad52